MKFKQFAEFLSTIERISSRNEMTVFLAEFLPKLSLAEIKPTMYMMQGRLVPKYVDLEFNISRKLILSSLSEIAGEDLVHSFFKRYGDVGLVAEEVVKLGIENKLIKNLNVDLFSSGSEMQFKDSNKSIVEVYEALKTVAEYSGKGSVEFKKTGYKNLIISLDPTSCKFATRVMMGELRLGISEKTVLDSLSWYLKGDKSLREQLDKSFGSKADIGELTELIIQTDKDKIEQVLSSIEIVAGIPVTSKLVERESSSENVWKRMPNCYAQPKLDGLRGQIHLIRNSKSQIPNSKEDTKSRNHEIENSTSHITHPTSHILDPKAKNQKLETNNQLAEVFIFSRNMENMTHQFPEIVEAVKRLPVESIILDSEIIGFDVKNDKYLTYQETMTRKRKYDIKEQSQTVPVKAMCFDVIYLNGQDISHKPFEERLEILDKVLNPSQPSPLNKGEVSRRDGGVQMLETIQCKSEKELDDYFFKQVNAGLEGIIIKEPGSIYEPGTRNFVWIKLKANTQSDLVDTIDVAVMGYYIGRGQRAKFGMGALLAGIYDPKTDKYYSVGKVGTGITEEQFQTIIKDLKPLELKEKPENYVVDKTLYPETWVKPTIIMEIDADEITRSPVHMAAKGVKTSVLKDNSDRGLSIRFPRMKIWKRDKEYPNTVEELVRMYELRKGKNK